MNEELELLLQELALAEKVRYCYQCGTCAGGCPVAGAEPSYNPRRMLEALARGEGEAVLAADELWLCTLCHTCLERCPQGVGLSHVFTRLKEIAAARGHLPESLLAELQTLYSAGRVIPLSGPIERRRAQLGLPAVDQQSGLADLRQIVEATSLGRVLAAARAKGEEKNG